MYISIFISAWLENVLYVFVQVAAWYDPVRLMSLDSVQLLNNTMGHKS